jgi:hypothetical protein
MRLKCVVVVSVKEKTYNLAGGNNATGWKMFYII